LLPSEPENCPFPFGDPFVCSEKLKHSFQNAVLSIEPESTLQLPGDRENKEWRVTANRYQISFGMVKMS
jgi:hypothetical protein